MFTVTEVEEDVKRVLGGVEDSEFYSRLNHAVEILATESNWDPLFGYLDVCVDSCGRVVLPREVGTPLSVNIDGSPAQGHDWLFTFHLNGVGSCSNSVGWHWIDDRPVASFRPPLETGSSLVAQLENSADAGKSLRVFGYGVNGDWIRTVEAGVFVDGFLVPLASGVPAPNPNAPKIAVISRIQKDRTLGVVRLYRVESDGTSTRISSYFPDELEPQYRRIQLSKRCAWARVAFRKNVLELSRLSDLIPLHSKYAIVLMAKSLKKMDEDRIDDAAAYQKMAIRLLTKKQESVEIPGGPSVQVANGNLLADKGDRME